MACEFKPGDVVKMKSGGIVMTVVSTANDMVYCEWMDKQQKKADSFTPEVLALYTPPKPLQSPGKRIR